MFAARLKGTDIDRESAAFVIGAAALCAQRGVRETFTATATAKTAGGATATAPVIVIIEQDDVAPRKSNTAKLLLGSVHAVLTSG